MGRKQKVRPTPQWMTVEEAGRGWRVSRRQALRIIRKYEAEVKRPALVPAPGASRKMGIRTADFLAVSRGDVHAAPMIPEIAVLRDQLDAQHELIERLMKLMAAHFKHAGFKPPKWE